MNIQTLLRPFIVANKAVPKLLLGFPYKVGIWEFDLDHSEPEIGLEFVQNG